MRDIVPYVSFYDRAATFARNSCKQCSPVEFCDITSKLHASFVRDYIEIRIILMTVLPGYVASRARVRTRGPITGPGSLISRIPPKSKR